MQDFDFVRYYKKPNNAAPANTRGGKQGHAPHPVIRKLSLYSAISLFFFGTGLLTGIVIHERKFQTTENVVAAQGARAENGVLSSSNINPEARQPARPTQTTTPQKGSNLENTLRSDSTKFVIHAKTYDSNEDAQWFGNILRRNGLPVYLTQSGTKFKVYVGPIFSKSEAYEKLKQVKSFNEFRGAILYER